MKFSSFYKVFLVVGFFALFLLVKNDFNEKLKLNLVNDFEVDFNDTDGGFNFLIKGSGKRKDGRIIEDRCIDQFVPGRGQSNNLIEVVCFKKNCYEILISPPVDYICQDGLLAKVVSSSMVIESDGGDNIFRKGADLLNGQIINGTGDSCLNEDTVQEYSFGANLAIKCPKGTNCKDGVCRGAKVSCKELISNSNNPAEKRFNLVFVGSDYHLLEAFLWDAKTILGENNNVGFFDYEPFKSNREKFNLWYVDRFNEMAPVVEAYSYEIHEQRNVDGVKNARALADKCKFDYDLENVIMVHLVANKGTLDSAINIATMREVQLFNQDAHKKCQKIIKKDLNLLAQDDPKGCNRGFSKITVMPSIDFNGDGKIAEYPDDLIFNRLVQLSSSMNLCKSQKNFNSLVENLCANGIDNLGRVVDHGSTLVHEFGHHFGFFDTSKASNIVDANWAGTTIGNCFVANSKASCIANAPWKFLIGNGCGADGVLDCKKDDSSYDLEVGCFDGCIGSVKSFRPERADTYTYGLAVPEDSNGKAGDRLGLWEQWYLNRMMEAYLNL